MQKKLTKSSSNIVISGVLGGIGEYLNLDPTILRVIFIVICFFGVGTPIFLYFILMLVLPSGHGRHNGDHNNHHRDNYQSYHNYRQSQNPQGPKQKRKEAEKLDDDDEWSDF